MALLANSAEGGSNTTLVSAANSGGSSGDAWSSVNRGSAASAYTFSTTAPAHGSLGYAIQVVSGEACQLIWTYVGGSGAASLFYYKHPGTPTAASQLATIRNGTGNAAIISIGTDNKLILQNAVGGNIRVSPTALVANDVIWVTFRALKGGTTSTGTLEYAWGYKGSATVVDTALTSAANAGTADMVSTRYGRTTSSTWATTMWYDSLESDTSATALIASREQREQTASASLAVSTSLAATAVPSVTAAAALAVGTSLAATGVPSVTAASALAVSTALAATGVPAVTAAASLAVSTALAATVAPAVTADASLAVSTALAATVAPSVAADATLGATLDLSATSTPQIAVDVDLALALILTAESVPNYPSASGPVVPLPHRLAPTGGAHTLTPAGALRTLTPIATVRTLVPTDPPTED